MDSRGPALPSVQALHQCSRSGTTTSGLSFSVDYIHTYQNNTLVLQFLDLSLWTSCHQRRGLSSCIPALPHLSQLLPTCNSSTIFALTPDCSALCKQAGSQKEQKFPFWCTYMLADGSSACGEGCLCFPRVKGCSI